MNNRLSLNDLLKMVGCSDDFAENLKLQTNKIYHYTNAQAFTSIVKAENGKNGIWLSNVEFLNDNQEIELGKKLCSEKLESSTFISDIEYNYYTASFCLADDSLEHWRSYSANGSGICIEFDLHKNKYFDDLEYEGMRPPICPVIYDSKKAKELINLMHSYIFDDTSSSTQKAISKSTIQKLIKDIDPEVLKKITSPGAIAGIAGTLLLSPISLIAAVIGGTIYSVLAEESKNDRINGIKNILQQVDGINTILNINEKTSKEDRFKKIMQLIYPLFKHNTFSSEKEIRLIYFDNKKDNSFTNKIKYRISSNNMIIPYIKSSDLLSDDEPVLLPISKVTIGPVSKQDWIEKSVKFFLDNNGYNDVEVIKSKIPYRG